MLSAACLQIRWKCSQITDFLKTFCLSIQKILPGGLSAFSSSGSDPEGLTLSFLLVWNHIDFSLIID